VRRHGKSRACAANQSSNAATSFVCAAPQRSEGGFVLSFEFKNLPNREIHENREKEMKNIPGNLTNTKKSKTTKL
jgi:hypothetical protein